MITAGLICAICGSFVASIFDLQSRIIPNALSYGMIVLGFALAAVAPETAVEILTGGLICGGVALAAYSLGALGGGDVKLLFGVGLLVGSQSAWGVLLWAYAFACVGFIGFALYALIRSTRIHKGPGVDLSGLPLAPAILIACIAEPILPAFSRVM